MAGEQDPQDEVNHVQTARNAATRARTLLSPVLRQLQEAALGLVDVKIQARLLRAAEQVAETSGMLYELEHGNKNTFDNLAAAVRARDHLRTALSALQAPEMAGSFPPECADVVASALAIVFAAARGGDWKDRELLRRARKRALMMRVPIASGDDEGSRPPPPRCPIPWRQSRSPDARQRPAVLRPPPGRSRRPSRCRSGPAATATCTPLRSVHRTSESGTAV